jgi:peptidoglycan-associated lipoprotein
MKVRRIRLVVTGLLLVAVALVSGCAKKKPPEPTQAPPVPAETTTPAPAPTPAPPAETPPTPPGVSDGEFSPAFFDVDQSSLNEQGRVALDKNAKLLRDHPDAKVEIEGHCDERGTVEYNQALGQRRAEAARDYLVAQGVTADRLTVISYGKDRPFSEGHDEGAWSQNRRAHFRVRS